MRDVLVGNKEPLFMVLERILLGLKNGNNVILLNIGDFEDELLKEKSAKILIIFNVIFDTPSQINKLVWNKLRLNEERLGKKIAGLPVLILGMDKKFLETPEAKVFRDFPAHHQYLTKPLNLYKLLLTLTILSPIDQSSLSVIKGDAPESILGALEHDLKSVSKKFDYSGTDEEIGKRFHNVEINLKNYEIYQKDKKKLRKVKEEVETLKKEIRKRKGKTWRK